MCGHVLQFASMDPALWRHSRIGCSASAKGWLLRQKLNGSANAGACVTPSRFEKLGVVCVPWFWETGQQVLGICLCLVMMSRALILGYAVRGHV